MNNSVRKVLNLIIIALDTLHTPIRERAALSVFFPLPWLILPECECVYVHNAHILFICPSTKAGQHIFFLSAHIACL